MGNGGDIGSVNVADPSDPASKVNLKNGWLFGLRGTFNQGEHFGHEITYAYHRTGLRIGPPTTTASGFAIHTVTYGFNLYLTNASARIRPFVQGGGGFGNFCPPGAGVSRGGCSRKWEFMYGAGVKLRTSERTLVRFDYRVHESGKPFDLAGQSGRLRRNEISIGISYVI